MAARPGGRRRVLPHTALTYAREHVAGGLCNVFAAADTQQPSSSLGFLARALQDPASAARNGHVDSSRAGIEAQFAAHFDFSKPTTVSDPPLVGSARHCESPSAAGEAHALASPGPHPGSLRAQDERPSWLQPSARRALKEALVRPQHRSSCRLPVCLKLSVCRADRCKWCSRRPSMTRSPRSVAASVSCRPAPAAVGGAPQHAAVVTGASQIAACAQAQASAHQRKLARAAALRTAV